MRILLPFIINILFTCCSVSAQYDSGTVIYADNANSAAIQKNYKVVDFDGDNFADIILIKDGNPNQLSWYKGDGSGNFSEQDNLMEIKEDHKENEIYLKDMNGDEINDIVFQNSTDGFSILLNDGKGNISKQKDNQVTEGNSCGADLKEIVDIDGDCDLDCIFWNKIVCAPDDGRNLGHCLIGYNKGNGVFKSYDYLDKSNLEMFLLIEAGDIDGDNNVDIITSGIKPNDGNNELFVRLYKNNDSTKEELILPAGVNFAYIEIRNIDSGGSDELFIELASKEIDNHGDSFNYIRSQVLQYSIQTKTFVILEEYNSWFHNYLPKPDVLPNELYDGAYEIQFGYQNADKNLDILSFNTLQGNLQWYIGDGNGGFEYDREQVVQTNHQQFSNKPNLRTIDFDNDGDLDVFVLANTETSSTLMVFKNETPVNTEDNHLILDKLSITPNQVQGNSYIKLALAQNQYSSKAIYNLYNIQGLKLITGNIEDSRIYIPGLPAGMYLVEVLVDCHKRLNKLLIN